jgi:hypothetical protein
VCECCFQERTAHDDLLSLTPDVQQDGVRGRMDEPHPLRLRSVGSGRVAT